MVVEMKMVVMKMVMAMAMVMMMMMMAMVIVIVMVIVMVNHDAPTFCNIHEMRMNIHFLTTTNHQTHTTHKVAVMVMVMVMVCKGRSFESGTPKPFAQESELHITNADMIWWWRWGSGWW